MINKLHISGTDTELQTQINLSKYTLTLLCLHWEQRMGESDMEEAVIAEILMPRPV